MTWVRLGSDTVHSSQPTITVSSALTGDFLCTALNTVGPSLAASLKVSVRDFPRRLQLEAEDFRSSVRLHFPLA